VSNSSTSSFVVFGVEIGIENKDKINKAIYWDVLTPKQRVAVDESNYPEDTLSDMMWNEEMMLLKDTPLWVASNEEMGASNGKYLVGVKLVDTSDGCLEESRFDLDELDLIGTQLKLTFGDLEHTRPVLMTGTRCC